MVVFFLSKKGIATSDISSRFSDVEVVLGELFGAGGKAMIIATLLKLCQEYSLNLDLSYAESPTQRLEQLKDRIIIDRLMPKHYRRGGETGAFEDRTGELAPWSD